MALLLGQETGKCVLLDEVGEKGTDKGFVVTGTVYGSDKVLRDWTRAGRAAQGEENLLQ